MLLIWFKGIWLSRDQIWRFTAGIRVPEESGIRTTTDIPAPPGFVGLREMSEDGGVSRLRKRVLPDVSCRKSPRTG